MRNEGNNATGLAKRCDNIRAHHLGAHHPQRKAMTMPRPNIRILVVVTFLLALASCAPIRLTGPAEPSQAYDRPQETTLGRAIASEQARHAGLSGFRLLNNGSSALVTRGVLADLAERSIDLQYFIFDADDIGAFIADRLLAAANRGVRVRMIIDDYQSQTRDATLARLDAHPNIEIRVYNPYPDRALWRPMQMLLDLDRLGRRMHNKVYAVDGQTAILGGRNLSNHYFEGEGETNFRDVDVLASGPVVKDVLRQFDSYWNNPVVVPVTAFNATATPGPVTELPPELHKFIDAEHGPFAEYLRRQEEIRARMLQPATEFIWAQAIAVAEPPVRQGADAAKPSAEVARTLAIQRQTAGSELVMQTAYFVPGDNGVKALTDLVQRGVRVRVMTNSLVTTDVPAVHAGYSRYREALIAGGVELHEYRPDANRPAPKGHLLRLGRSESALHAKVIVHDQRMVWIGSANFDPRSRRLNTETGLLIDSTNLAGQLLKTMERDFGSQQSWKLSLETDATGGMKRLSWNGMQNGKIIKLDREPDAGLLKRFGVLLFSLLPIEELL